MQRQSPVTQSQSPTRPVPHVRPVPCIHLCSGDTVGAFVEYAREYGQASNFFASSRKVSTQTASHWIANRIKDIAAMCETLAFHERPLVMPIPTRALADTELLDTCIKAAAQTRLCHQELSLEVTDSAISTHAEQAHRFMHAFRRKGFRVSIDARKSWAVEMPDELWLLVDTLRIRSTDLAIDESLEVLVETAAASGVAIVAERPYWRDGDAMAAQGVDYGLRPRADA